MGIVGGVQKKRCHFNDNNNNVVVIIIIGHLESPLPICSHNKSLASWIEIVSDLGSKNRARLRIIAGKGAQEDHDSQRRGRVSLNFLHRGVSRIPD